MYAPNGKEEKKKKKHPLCNLILILKKKQGNHLEAANIQLQAVCDSGYIHYR